ncbi:MAG: Anti-sigma regulatory factor (Ser/Thr protein kinase) [Marinobacter excellens HL-55]|uniref:Anti-sigma regulatory factor (Ser/Thr protein kinase) n=1 Tax=Marinobacter excellens HL-55 TaxID=1305731 RepID=A0A0P7ZIF7_9GAMM|nr:MAG: Anti-sigma regulatory factor (Ser/Thr protein kinase) [Marinobacter excellens HL-55]
MTLAISPDDSVSSILTYFRTILPEEYSDSERMYDCCTIIDEFHANMREHVAGQDDDFKWWLGVSHQGGVIRLSFQYAGPCFDPTQAQSIVDQSIEFRRIGGLGLALISQLSDKLDYTYNSGFNTLLVEVNTTGFPKEDEACL